MIRSSTLTTALLLLGSIGLADAILLLLIGVSANAGTLFYGALGLPLLLWGVWRRQHQHAPLPLSKRLKNTLCALLAILFVGLAVTVVLLLVSARDESRTPVRYAVVLGAGLRGDRLSHAGAERCLAGLRYVTEHPDVSVIVSGGRGPGESRTEAEAMAEFFQTHGVAAHRILQEKESKTTHQNLKFTRDLLNKSGVQKLPPLLIITSDFHIPRSKLIARRLGFEAYGLPAPTPWYQYPNCFARESFAYLKSWLFDR